MAKKHIDADHLRAEIELREKIMRNSANQISDSEKKTYYSSCADALLELLPFIDSLQQEQPEQKKNCAECPHCVDRKDQFGWHFKGCFGGPYKGKFIAEIDECPLQQEPLIHTELCTLIACDVIQATAKRATEKPQDKDKEEDLMIKKMEYLNMLEKSFFQQEHPEVDLEKFTEKIKTFQGRYKHPEVVSIKGAMAFMARMFYQYPNVARQWYDNLPKVTMD